MNVAWEYGPVKSEISRWVDRIGVAVIHASARNSRVHSHDSFRGCTANPVGTKR